MSDWQWTAHDVKAALVRAFEVLHTVPVRDNFRLDGGSFWPSHTYEADEIEEQRKQAIMENRKIRDRRQFTPRDIQRMETILLGDGDRKGWLAEFLSHKPGHRRCLARYAQWTAAGWSLASQCRRRGWAYSTFRRRCDEGAKILAAALNEARVPA